MILRAWNQMCIRDRSIVLDKVVNGRFFRIRTTAVSTAEENQYLYYQNVSLLEMELYEEVPLVYCLEVPEIQVKEDGSRYLPLPVVPEGYELSFIGADYEEIIGAVSYTHLAVFADVGVAVLAILNAMRALQGIPCKQGKGID